MRIAHTVEFYRPRVGGAEKVIAELSERLANRGHAVTVLTSLLPGAPREEEINGVRVRRFEISGNAATGIKGEVDAYRRELLEGGYDMMLNYACQAWPTDLAYDLLNRLSCAKIVAPCGYSALKGSLTKRALFANYFRTLPTNLARYDRIVYHSSNYIDYVLGLRWGLTNGEVIPNGVDTSELSPPTGRHPEPPRVVTIGNHYQAKNHEDFFGLVERFSPAEADFRLVATPERVRRGCLDNCTEGAAGGTVSLIDGGDRAAVVTELQNARVFVLTSRIECSPLTVLEGLAAGVPFVSYDVGCVRDFPGGLVVRDQDEMEVAVRWLLADPLAWEEISKAGRIFAEERDWDRITSRYEHLYEVVAAERQNAASVEVSG